MKTDTKFFLIGLFLFICFWTCDKIVVKNIKMSDYAVHGIDVSRYQQNMDWSAVQKDNVHFSFIKATQGQKYKDPYFKRNWQKAKRSGIARGAYHFFEFGDAAHVKKQARNFINTVKLERGDLPPVLDIEVEPTQRNYLDLIHIWVNEIQKHYGRDPIIYTNEFFYNTYLANNVNGLPLWIAKYNHKPPKLKDGRYWDFWQYRDNGKNYARKGHIDLNVYCCDEKRFWEEFR